MKFAKSLQALFVAGLLVAGAGCAKTRAVETVRTIQVQDMRERPIAGAQVHVQGQGIVSQVATGPDGSVRVPVLDKPLSLVVSYPGYQVTTLAVRAMTTPVVVTLKEDH